MPDQALDCSNIHVVLLFSAKRDQLAKVSSGYENRVLWSQYQLLSELQGQGYGKEFKFLDKQVMAETHGCLLQEVTFAHIC